MNITNFKKLTLVFALSGFFQVQSQDRQDVKRIRSNYDLPNLKRIEQKLQRENVLQRSNALRIAKQKGWKTQFTLNDGRFVELQKIVDGKPIYNISYNDNAAKSTRVHQLRRGGSLGLNLLGQGMTAYIWDAGVARMTHQEYKGENGENRFSVGDQTDQKNGHSAHVTGTIIAAGVKQEARGMAPYAKGVGYDWTNDESEVVEEASKGMLVSNHSYGYRIKNSSGDVIIPQYFFGAYIDESRTWDEIMFNAPNYLMVVAAGNDGRDDRSNKKPVGGYGFDKLTGHATAKNNLVVANAQDADVDSNGNLLSLYINAGSSEGPTDDYRIKPDITGNGTRVYSTYSRNDSDYTTISGTSMASPNVTGTLLLLQQHAKNVRGSFIKASTLKGLALHTADDAGVSGPDAVFGWGLLNAKKAAEAISNNTKTSRLEELTLASGQTYTLTVKSDGINPLKSSISWTDRPGEATKKLNSTTPVLVNDLDIRVTKGRRTYFPYKLTGPKTNEKKDNNVDPFERVDIDNASGEYTITITNKGSLEGGSQNFSLIITGLEEGSIRCEARKPTNLKVVKTTSTTSSLTWFSVSGTTYDIKYRPVGTDKWQKVSVPTNMITLKRLLANTKYEAQVRSKCKTKNSNYSSLIKFETVNMYCVSKGKTTEDEHISRFQLANLDKKSEGNGYSDFTAEEATVVKGKTYTATITPKWSGTPYKEGYSIWIDYNQDGDFEDNGEQVFLQEPTKETVIKATFDIPNKAKLGKTRMRVSIEYDEKPGACKKYTYGEVEDYSVNITNDSYYSELDTKTTSDNNLVLNNRKLTSFVVYPNPAYNSIEIKLEAKLLETSTYKIVNIVGQKVQSGKLKSNKLDISGLNKGVYIIEVSNGKKIYKSKILKK